MPPLIPTPNIIPIDILRDLACRFTANIPTEERNNIRICFQIELAYWLFIDHYCKPSDKLHHLAHVPFNIFAWLMFQVTPYLQAYVQQDVEKILADFKEYKWKVPTYGAILMDANMSQVLLVQGFGSSWMFPKGKVNKDEEAVVCAIREVKEETGYDISSLVNANHFIESNANDRNARLYLVVGVDTSFPFKPQTQYEIRQIGWFDVAELPENKKDVTKVINRGYNVNQFYPIFTFIKRLKRWIEDKKSGENQINSFRCPNSSMRFPYPNPNDRRTLWEMESPMPASTPLTAPPLTMPVASSSASSSAAAVAVGRDLLEKTFGQFSGKPTDGQKWATRFQEIQNQEQVSKSEPTRGHQEKFIATHSTNQNKDKHRQAKRRLLFDEQKPAAGNKTSTERYRTDKMKTSKPHPNANFFDGPGAHAWLNFTLSLNDFL